MLSELGSGEDHERSRLFRSAIEADRRRAGPTNLGLLVKKVFEEMKMEMERRRRMEEVRIGINREEEDEE